LSSLHYYLGLVLNYIISGHNGGGVSMKCKKKIFLILLSISILGMGIHKWVIPFPDNIVRILGVFMMINLCIYVYLSIKNKVE